MPFTKSELNKQYYRSNASRIKAERKKRYAQNKEAERASSLRRYYDRKNKSLKKIIEESIDTQLDIIKPEPQQTTNAS